MNNALAGNFDRVNAAVEENLADKDSDLPDLEGIDMPEMPEMPAGEVPAMDGEAPGMQGGSAVSDMGNNMMAGVKFVYSIATVLMFVLYCLMFASHLMIHACKKYVKKQVRFNQIVTIILFAATIAYLIVMIFTTKGVLDMIMDLACLFVLNMLVCVESKLGVYKLRRAELTEEGGWTEEEKEATKKQLFGE